MPTTEMIDKALLLALLVTTPAAAAPPQAGTPGMIDATAYGAIGDGRTDSGSAVAAAVAAATARGLPLVFPRTPRGYYLSGSFPELDLGELRLGGNRFAGPGLGDPTRGLGRFNNTYTNPFNVVTDVKYILDPAAIPQQAPTANIGLSIECAPNRPNPLNRDPHRNWIACVYRGADTGRGGAAGTLINTGVDNDVLNVDENSGTVYEIDVNANGVVKDGGITRGIFLTGGGNPGRPFNSVALDIQHSAYDGSRLPWSTGISIRSSTDMLQMFKDSADETGAFIQALDQAGRPEFSVDKMGRVVAASVDSAAAVVAGAVRTRPVRYASLPRCGEATEGTQQPVIDSRRNDWGAVIAGGGSFHVLAYCDGADWTVMAK